MGIRTTIYATVAAALLIVVPARAVYTPLYSFGFETLDPREPYGGVTKSGSLLYGMTEDGGTASQGSMFQYDTSNQSFSLLHSFTVNLGDGASPRGTLLVSRSKLYGVTHFQRCSWWRDDFRI